MPQIFRSSSAHATVGRETLNRFTSCASLGRRRALSCLPARISVSSSFDISWWRGCFFILLPAHYRFPACNHKLLLAQITKRMCRIQKHRPRMSTTRFIGRNGARPSCAVRAARATRRPRLAAGRASGDSSTSRVATGPLGKERKCGERPRFPIGLEFVKHDFSAREAECDEGFIGRQRERAHIAVESQRDGNRRAFTGGERIAGLDAARLRDVPEKCGAVVPNREGVITSIRVPVVE